MSRFTSIMVALALWMTASSAFALGLGNMEVRSYLGQPLNVRVQLISRSPRELGSVTAGLASVADFESMGLTHSISVPLRFRVFAEGAAPYVEVSSQLPVNEPVVQIVVEVRWEGGRMLREYTLFLDPPTFQSRAPAPMIIPSLPPGRSTDNEPSRTESYPSPATQDVVETIKPPAPVRVAPTASTPPAQVAVETAAEVSPPPQPSGESGPATTSTVEMADPAADPASPETVTVPAEPAMESAISEESVALESETYEALSDPAESQMEEASVKATVSPEPGAIDAVASTEEELAAVPDIPPPAQVTGDTENLLEPESPADVPGQTGPGFESDVNELTENAREEGPASANEPVTPPEAVGVTEPRPSEPVDKEAVAVADEAVIAPPGDESGEVIGPVQRGQTLWGIASRYVEGSSYSINQAMLAIQRQNPDAFGGKNINSLRSGAILRMPTFSEIGRLDKRQAMLEALRQEEHYKAMRSGLPVDDLPVLADTARMAEPVSTAADSPAQSSAAGPEDSSADSRLQLVPPSGQEALDGGSAGASGQAVGSDSSGSIEEVLARTEEELANAQQENAYLAERIAELEEQLANSGGGAQIEDSGLAEMEADLREKRLSGDDPDSSAVAVGSEEDAPWYQRSFAWVGGLLILLIAAVIWVLRRMGRGAKDPGPVDGAAETETVKQLRNEAEDILESLDVQAEAEQGADNVIELEQFTDPGGTEAETSTGDDEAIPVDEGPASGESADVEEQEPAEEKAPPARPVPNDGEAVELDSDDPEVKLDLARAYISMGDHDAARGILEEVLECGNEDQVREARDMMEEV
jgi:pilus assembly protein FimV